jgi:hypothetical protein
VDLRVSAASHTSTLPGFFIAGERRGPLVAEMHGSSTMMIHQHNSQSV